MRTVLRRQVESIHSHNYMPTPTTNTISDYHWQHHRDNATQTDPKRDKQEKATSKTTTECNEH
eukprot:12897380-Prorocentrum_lima.AAC.1